MVGKTLTATSDGGKSLKLTTLQDPDFEPFVEGGQSPDTPPCADIALYTYASRYL